jgi:hypothetical protein
LTERERQVLEQRLPVDGYSRTLKKWTTIQGHAERIRQIEAKAAQDAASDAYPAAGGVPRAADIGPRPVTQ